MGASIPKQITSCGHQNKKAKKTHLNPIELLFPASGPVKRPFQPPLPKANSWQRGLSQATPHRATTTPWR
jgi:hypothetical protein